MLEALGKTLDAVLARPCLQVAIRQRAKFEGWFKVELAYALELAGASVSLEYTLPTGARADLRVTLAGETNDVMLKTVNTNFRFPGINPAHRPITKNIAGVIEDIEKLRASDPSSGLTVFPVFPVSAVQAEREQQLKRYLDRIQAAGDLLRDGFVKPGFSDGSWGISWYVVSSQSTDER